MKRRTGYLHKRGDNWYVSWRVEGKLLKKALRDDQGQPITNRREAEEARHKFMAPMAVADEAEVLQSIAGRIEGRKAELAKWEEQSNPALPITHGWSAFLASPNRPDSGAETLYQYECQWSRFAEWMKEKHPDVTTLRGVTVDLAARYAVTLNHGLLSPNTYNKHLNLLTLVFNIVKDKARLTVNPWQSITRKKLAVQGRRELTIEELRKVCQSAEGELRVLLAVGVYSGLRLGDCCTLRWSEVDLHRGLITRIPNKTGRRKPEPVKVPLHAALAEILSGIPAASRGEYVLPEMAALYANRIDAVTDKVQAHFLANGIRVWKPGTGPGSKDATRAVVQVGFHSLRHSFVSLCREANAPLAVVEAIVGHSNPAMTRHYSHIGELAAQKAIALLPSITGHQQAEPPKRDAETVLREVVAIAKKMTVSTWRAKRDEIVALVGAIDAVAPVKREFEMKVEVRHHR